MAREMKDSGIEWIGEIPAEWETANIRKLFSFGKGLPITKEDLCETGSPVISYGQIHSKANNGTTTKPELLRYVDMEYIDTNPESLVRNGDFVFADTSEDLDGCGNSVYIDTNDVLFAGYHTVILKSRERDDNQYFAFLFLSDVWRKQIRGRVSGVKVFSISQRILRDVSVIIPPRKEQRRIADYLAGECNRIDSIIEQTRASIEEYKKLKQAVITHAVTKGIRPDRPMKESGVKWIGKIPADFICRKIKSFTETISKGATPKDIMNEINDEFCIRFIKSENIVDNHLTDKPIFGIRAETNEGELKRSQLSGRDILFVIAGASIGKTAIMDESLLPSNTNQATCFIRIKNEYMLYQKYIWYYLQSDIVKTYINLHSVQSAQPNISMADLGNMRIPIPNDTNELQTIVETIMNMDQKISEIIKRKIDLLKELDSYKKSLIYEYVTGKKEVPA